VTKKLDLTDPIFPRDARIPSDLAALEDMTPDANCGHGWVRSLTLAAQAERTGWITGLIRLTLKGK
jgi:hypothetical protein